MKSFGSRLSAALPVVNAAQLELGLSLGTDYFWSGNIVSWLFLQQVQVDESICSLAQHWWLL